MIHRLDQLTDLAIVGLSVVIPGGEGVAGFGRHIYRGLPITGGLGDQASLGTAASGLVTQVCADARLPLPRMPILCLNPALERLLREAGTGTRVVQVSGVASALSMATDWFENGAEEVALLVDFQEDPEALVAILVTEYRSALDNDRPVYALVRGAAAADATPDAAAISAALGEARRSAALQQHDLGLILAGTLQGGSLSSPESDGLLRALGGGKPLACALGSGLPGLLGVVQAAWCLSHRVIPCAPGWNGPANLTAWQGSSFYVETESRAWYLPQGQGQRIAGLDLFAADGAFLHLLLSDTPSPVSASIEAPGLESLQLFPLSAISVAEMMSALEILRSQLTEGSDLAAIARSAYRRYLSGEPGKGFVLGLLGSGPADLQREIDFAIKGLPVAFEKHVDWQTPLGSFFTPRPLGKEGKVSFVYPGAFNSYPGIGRDLFYLYPNLFAKISEISRDVGSLLNEQQLYTRSLIPLGEADLAGIEARLNADPITMLISGSCLAFLYTEVLRKVFEIQPASAFGYSLGEVSMLFASRVWTEADGTSQALRESPLFRSRLVGPQNAVREYWDLPPRAENDPPEPLWGNYLLMTGPEKVREALVAEPRVYLTHINTPRQVVIGGDRIACRRVIDTLKCKSLQAPFNYAIHCEPIHSEFDMLTELHSVPVVNQPGMTLYSAATYQPMPIDRQKIAQQIAYELCHCLDFPRLIQQAYQDGARIFIELGAGSNCARWVNDTLQGQPHAAYAINRKGVDDHTSILRLVARMLSHQVPLNLSVLYQD